MSEDEIIDKINYMINNWHRNVVEIDIQWIQGLLDLYQHKKGRIDELKQELLQEKEKNSKIQKYVRSNEWTEDYEKSSCRTKILRILEEE